MTAPIPGISLSPLAILAVLGAFAVVLADRLPHRKAVPGAAVAAAAGTALAVTGLRWSLDAVLRGAPTDLPGQLAQFGTLTSI